MKKRIFIFGLLFLTLIATSIYLYNYFKPTEIAAFKTVEGAQQNSYTFDESIEAIKQKPGNHLIFLSDNQTDSKYILDSLLQPILSDKNITIPDIVYVDVSSVKDLTVTRLRDTFHVERAPAFVYITVSDDLKCTINASLTYYAEKPFSQDNLKTWLFDNGLWNGPYSVR